MATGWTELIEIIDVACTRIDRHPTIRVAQFVRDDGQAGSTGTFVAVKGYDGVEEQPLVGPEGKTPEEDVPGWEYRDDNQLRSRHQFKCPECPDTLPVVDFTTGPNDPGLLSLLDHVIGNKKFRVGERRALVSLVQMREMLEKPQIWFRWRV